MRPLEILISLLLTMYLLWPITGKKRPPALRILPALATLVTAVHAMNEGVRWQMAPLYALVLVVFVWSSAAFIRFGQNAGLRRRSLQVIPSLLLLGVAIALPILLPVPSIPSPSGPYQVGTRNYELTDESRKELYSGKDEPRRFQIQIWYPSQADPSDERAPWMSRAEIFAPAVATYIDMPSFFLDHLALVKLPAYRESKVAPSEAGYPVILFSHGWNGFNAQNSGQAIELASHGYVVIGVQHTYGAVVTVFDDGTIALNNSSALPATAPQQDYEAAAQKLVDQWAGDMVFVLDSLANRNSSVRDPFGGMLDLARVGVYGHSTGGGAAIQFCGTDARCKALLGMDPFMRPVSEQVLDGGVTQPAFFMFSQRWADDQGSHNNELFRKFMSHVPQSLGVISIDGTTHYDFSDLPLLSPLAPHLGLKGPIDGKYVTRMINDYLLSFFDIALRNEATDLFDGQNQKYFEVRFNR